MFFNELELLELRLMTLNQVVDYFVLVEANKTHTNNKKDFIFAKNKPRFKKYLPKIIHIKVKDSPELDRIENAWQIEGFQRNCISRGLVDARDEDRIIISDVDEIPDPARLVQVKHSSKPVTFKQYLFYYYVNCWARREWNGSVITPFKNMMPPHRLKGLARKGLNRVRNSGWHYSYMGGVKKIRSKLVNLYDAYLGRDKVGTDKDILRKMNSQRDLWDENRTYQLIDIETKGFAPLPIKKFIKKYPHFYFGQLQ